MTTVSMMQIDGYLRLLLPGLTSLFLTLLSVSSFHDPTLAQVMPLFGAMAVYYWTIYKREVFPLWWVFCLGILQDTLTGMPLGVMAGANVLLYGTTLSQRRFFIKEHFIVVLFGFALSAVGVTFYCWAVLSLYFQVFFPLHYAMVQWALSVVCYSGIHWLLSKVFIILPDRLPHFHA